MLSIKRIKHKKIEPRIHSDIETTIPGIASEPIDSAQTSGDYEDGSLYSERGPPVRSEAVSTAILKVLRGCLS